MAQVAKIAIQAAALFRGRLNNSPISFYLRGHARGYAIFETLKRKKEKRGYE